MYLNSVISATMHNGLSEKEIIAQVLSGNQQAFAGLVTQYQNYVFTLVLRIIKSREDAEEVAQDVFIKAYRSLKDFRGDSKFSTWLYTIANTTSISFLRKKKLDIQSLDSEKVFEIADSVDSGFRANLIEQKSKKEMVHQAINMLSADDAEVITLFYQHEQNLQEIGKILGQEPNTVKVRLHRARTRLKEKMERYFLEEVKDIY